MGTRVTVIGTVFIDCKGFSKHEFNPAGRNLGNVKFFHGGVGRNVAETLAHLDVPVRFVASVDRTGIGQEVVTRLYEAGIDTEYLIRTESLGMGFWLALLDNKGDLAGAISQMPDLAKLEQAIAKTGRMLIEDSSHVVLELDLNANITRTILGLAAKANKPVYGIPGNLSVILQNLDILSGLDCFICNDIEAAQLLGVTLDRHKPDEMLEQLTRFINKMNMRSMVVTMGSEGSVFYDACRGTAGVQPIFPVTVVDSSGAGDAFFSGTVMGLVLGQTLDKSVVIGSKVASWTIESTENTCTDIARRKQQDEVFTALKPFAIA